MSISCFPASKMVIGQLINAIQSGKYDPHKVALVITQTGGGCRASNYIHQGGGDAVKVGVHTLEGHSFALVHIGKEKVHALLEKFCHWLQKYVMKYQHAMIDALRRSGFRAPGDFTELHRGLESEIEVPAPFSELWRWPASA